MIEGKRSFGAREGRVPRARGPSVKKKRMKEET